MWSERSGDSQGSGYHGDILCRKTSQHLAEEQKLPKRPGLLIVHPDGTLFVTKKINNGRYPDLVETIIGFK